MFGVKLSNKEPFVYSVFGLQLPEGDASSQQVTLQDQFDALIADHATHIDRVLQEDDQPTRQRKTFIWLGYWKSLTEYTNWWTGKEVSEFWASLPDNAGMWREIMTPNAGRAQHGTNIEEPAGLGHLGQRITQLDKMGYWGCHRHRMEASESDKFTSPVERVLKPRPFASGIRPGRVSVKNFPDNIYFVVNGQDHSRISKEELKHWSEKFDKLVETWIKDLVAAGPESGILDGRLCYMPETGVFRDSVPKSLNYNKKIQLFYFKDLRHMERIAMQNKGHVKLRGDFLKDYGPGGDMFGGKLGIWVDSTVLKSSEIECEYVGCAEGTGWMAWADEPEFS